MKNQNMKNQNMKNQNMKNLHIDTKVREITVTARQEAFEQSTLRQSSQFERVQMKTTMSNEMNSETALAVHRVDSASDRKRGRRRGRERDRERDRSKRSSDRERRGREREQATSKET
jgi:hypothetical protein